MPLDPTVTGRRNHGRGHSYRLDGEKATGITTALRAIAKPQFIDAAVKKAARYAVDYWDELAELKPTERYERILAAPRKALAEAGARGTNVHEIARRHLAGEEPEVPEEIQGFVDAYEKFLVEWDVQELLVERPVFSRKYRYAGTPDLVAKLADGKTWLLDWKTTDSGIWPENALQVAAALNAEFALDEDNEQIELPQIDATGCIHLRNDGSYELRPVEAGPEAFAAFVYARRLWDFVESSKFREDWVGEALTPPNRDGRKST